MPLFGLASSRPPFSDWLSQIERIVSRRRREFTQLSAESVPLLRLYYDAGVTAQEAADDLMGGEA